MEVCYERLRPGEVVARRQACPVAYLPCGILEWHGRHNPVGLDGVKAHALCVRLAEALGGLVWPTLWYGDNRDDILENVFGPENFALSRDHRPEVAAALQIDPAAVHEEALRSRVEGGWRLWQEVLRHSLHQILAYGFERVVVLCGHYPLSGPAREVAAEFGGRVLAFTEAELVQGRGFHGDHAARWETSLLLELTPGRVDLSELAGEPAEVTGVMGEDPRTATREYGAAGVAAVIEAVRERLAR